MKGWFYIPGVQDGARRLEDQLKGLDRVCADARNRAVLDLGCAEGEISRHLIEQCGAAWADGVDHDERMVQMARYAIPSYCGSAYRCNLGDPAALAALMKDRLRPAYDLVLLLAILHKLPDPAALIAALRSIMTEIVVVRLPAITGPYVHRKGDGRRIGDVRDWLAGFDLIEQTQGHCDEWTGTFRRSTLPS